MCRGAREAIPVKDGSTGGEAGAPEILEETLGTRGGKTWRRGLRGAQPDREYSENDRGMSGRFF